MGCDIHSVGQIRRNGKWESIVPRPGGDDRNYDSFAVMADVRNGEGFAGCDTGEGWPVMFPPRGLPEDCVIDSDYYIRTSEPFYWSFDEKKEKPEYDIWIGDHSHSWLSLDELLIIQERFKDKEYEIHGMLTLEQMSDLQKGKAPDSWCAWTNQYDHLKAKWKVPAIKRLKTLNKMIEALESLRDKNGLKNEDVRVVFGFDS